MVWSFIFSPWKCHCIVTIHRAFLDPDIMITNVYVPTSASLRYVYLSFLIISVSVLLAVDCTSVQGDWHKKSVTSQHTSWSLHFQGNFILVSRAASSVSAWFRDAEDTRRPGYQDAASRSIYQRPDSWHQEHLNNPSDPHTTPIMNLKKKNAFSIFCRLEELIT